MQLKQTARDVLLKPLQAVSGIVERRHTLPILANVLLEQKDGRLYVTATDLEMQITAHSDLPGKETQAVTVADQMIGHRGVNYVGEFESLPMGLQSQSFHGGAQDGAKGEGRGVES